MAKHGTGGRVQMRLYLEGILVENALTSVQVAGHTGQPASAQLELIPTNTIRHILPGTWAHVFVTDPWETEPTGAADDYKLLYEGVVINRGFTRQDDGRGFVVQCADPSIYWAEARQFWINATSSVGNIVDKAVVAATSGRGRFGTVSSTGAYNYLVSEMGKIMEDGEEHFLDSVIASLDDIGNVNPFYTNARNRFRLTDRIIRGPAGLTEKLFSIAMYQDFASALAGRVSGQSNLMQVVNLLLDSIMHEWVSVIAPPYVTTRIFQRDAFGNIKRESEEVRRKDELGARKVTLYKYKMSEETVVGNIIFKPHVYTIAAPTCNVLFPNMYDQMSFNENFLGETTRLQMRPQLPMLDKRLTQNLLLLRPTELEVFTALTRDPKRETWNKRTPDGVYADGAGQAPVFHDYDWTTNEERIRGLVYNFINLAPAPSTLTMGDQGKKAPRGAREGGVPKYLQNVASYEYYKSKFVARQTSISGPFNMRPVPGFPIVILDDSSANLNVVAYLDSITHRIDAEGGASTQYGIKYPRLYDEVDMNRPRFKGTGAEATIDFDLFVDDEGNYQFQKLFDGINRPPIPEWFDDAYKNLYNLDFRYAEWFGSNVGVVENRSFVEVPNIEISKQLAIDQNNAVDLGEVIDKLNAEYRTYRSTGREFIEASKFTARRFAKIDEAFRFVGASSEEFADKLNTKDKGAVFGTKPSKDRTINYRTAKLDRFVGDVSEGSGYSAVPIGEKRAKASKGTESAAGATADAANKMSGAFPAFDTTIHVGEEATDSTKRNELLTNPEQRAKSDWPRYEGRPLMYDFEFRLWQESVAAAGIEPTSATVLRNATMASYKSVTGGGVERKSAAEVTEATQTQKDERDAALKAERESTSAGDPPPSKRKNATPAQQAPTGDAVESGEQQALPQPLSEWQVVTLRRSIINAYREELARTRGFTG